MSNLSMYEIVKILAPLKRDLVSDGFDQSLDIISSQLDGFESYLYPTGTDRFTWTIPQKWTCLEGRLETIDHKLIFSYADHPLHVMSYSQSIDKIVTREELFKHLYTHRLPDAIPFKFSYYESTWGLCCSENVKSTLTENTYHVVIKSRFTKGNLKIGQAVSDDSISGKKEFIICAHLCHPCQANDDVSGVAVGIGVMRELQKRKNLKYRYRLLIVPETIGSISWLASQAKCSLEYTVGGLFLEMLGLDNPHALQYSFAGDTNIDRCFKQAVKADNSANWFGKFREVICNDERQFNAPGIRIAMLSLSRVEHKYSKYADGSRVWITGDGVPHVIPNPTYPYPEYHSSKDTIDIISKQSLEDSKNLVLSMIDTLERNITPLNLFSGEVCCSKFGIHIDYYENPEGHKALFDIMFLIDGTLSISQIADKLSIPFDSVYDVVMKLHEHDLVKLEVTK